MRSNRWLAHAALMLVSAGATLLILSQFASVGLMRDRAGDEQPTPEAPASNSAISTIAAPRPTLTPDDTGALQRGLVLGDEPNSANTATSSERDGLVSHVVQDGDTVWGIALAYGLRPETILWSNYKTLRDNPDVLSIGMVLTIPPDDGLMIEVEAGDTIDAIARRFKVQPNVLAQERLNGLSDINQALTIGQTLFVRGGERELVVWQLPELVQVGTQRVQTKQGVVSAKVYRVGVCGNVAIPLLGSGAFVLPTGSSFRSGYNFSGYHAGIDFGGKLGSPIYAADAGTVVFAGDAVSASGQFVGYGRYVVLDHGNGYQTLYAHNSSLTVLCGQQVSSGEIIAYMGSTGQSTGPHSHFEIRLNGAGVNPWGLFQ